MQFKEFQDANEARCNEVFHPFEEWSETDWGCALAGEVGELCNLLKKRRRGEWISKGDIADELADVLAYAFLVGSKVGIDVEEAARGKFNQVSHDHGSTVFLTINGAHSP